MPTDLAYTSPLSLFFNRTEGRLFFAHFMKIPCDQTIGNDLDRDADPHDQLCDRRVKAYHLEIIDYDKIAEHKGNCKTNQ